MLDDPVEEGQPLDELQHNVVRALGFKRAQQVADVRVVHARVTGGPQRNDLALEGDVGGAATGRRRRVCRVRLGALVIILFAGIIFIRSKEKAGKPVFVSN